MELLDELNKNIMECVKDLEFVEDFKDIKNPQQAIETIKEYVMGDPIERLCYYWGFFEGMKHDPEGFIKEEYYKKGQYKRAKEDFDERELDNCIETDVMFKKEGAI